MRRTTIPIPARRNTTTASASSCANSGGSQPTAPRARSTAGPVPEVMIGTASRASCARCTRRASSSVRPMAWPIVGNDMGEKRRGRGRDNENDGGPVGDVSQGGREDCGEHEDIAVDVGAHATAHALYG